MIEAGSCFGFPAKALEVLLCGPRTYAYDLERHGAIETFLVGPIHYALTTPADFLQQLIVAKISQDSFWSGDFLSIVRSRLIVPAAISGSSYRFLVE
jgi:hypothetical protein